MRPKKKKKKKSKSLTIGAESVTYHNLDFSIVPYDVLREAPPPINDHNGRFKQCIPRNQMENIAKGISEGALFTKQKRKRCLKLFLTAIKERTAPIPTGKLKFNIRLIFNSYKILRELNGNQRDLLIRDAYALGFIEPIYNQWFTIQTPEKWHDIDRNKPINIYPVVFQAMCKY